MTPRKKLAPLSTHRMNDVDTETIKNAVRDLDPSSAMARALAEVIYLREELIRRS